MLEQILFMLSVSLLLATAEPLIAIRQWTQTKLEKKQSSIAHWVSKLVRCVPCLTFWCALILLPIYTIIPKTIVLAVLITSITIIFDILIRRLLP